VWEFVWPASGFLQHVHVLVRVSVHVVIRVAARVFVSGCSQRLFNVSL